MDLREEIDPFHDDLNTDDDLVTWMEEEDQRSEDLGSDQETSRSRCGSSATFLSDDDEHDKSEFLIHSVEITGFFSHSDFM